MDTGCLYYNLNGNLAEINVQTSAKRIFDFGSSIIDLLVVEGRSIYFKNDKGKMFFVDLDWIYMAP